MLRRPPKADWWGTKFEFYTQARFTAGFVLYLDHGNELLPDNVLCSFGGEVLIPATPLAQNFSVLL